MSDEQVKEASWVVQSVTGTSAYFYGVSYSPEKFQDELERVATHISQSMMAGV
ncbi:MAG: hypothetical protein P8Y63_14440 [Deltaproteobacteria bacterium]